MEKVLMSSKIRVLSESMINQIAAGEVIENPASVVKELIENAVDAGSKKIIVEIWGGGLNLIRVSDDGCGMSRDDAVLCLERHATSKISSGSDLMRIATMGFRGEALASIASISRLSIETALDQGIGTRVVSDGSIVRKVEPCARNRGTTIEVGHLFHNVPARKKFQKSPNLCAGEVSKIVMIQSLAYPKLCFELYQQDRLMFSLPSSDAPFLEALKQRIEGTLGKEFMQGAYELDNQDQPFGFQGYIGSCQNTRPNRMAQYQFINQRAVTCSAISFAVKDAYGTRIPQDRYPIYVLHANFASSYVDVNVHPQKKEIRLYEEKEVKEKLKNVILTKLSGSDFVEENFSFSIFPFKEQPVIEQSFDLSYVPKTNMSPSAVMELPEYEFPYKPVVIGFFLQYALVDGSGKNPWVTDSKGFVILDLYLAKARLLYDSWKVEQSSIKQGLLFSLPFSCSLAEAHILMEHMPVWDKMGFSIHPSGKHTFLVDAIPSQLKEEEAVEFLRFLVSEGADCDRVGESWEGKIERRLASCCSKIAKRQPLPQNTIEAVLLIERLLKTPSWAICPLGNSIAVYLGEDEIRRKFSEKKKG